ncbi:hypothetical protein I3843_04G042400 [Carya illinoinensis]|uniref:Uncharacterized protein n=1 Tax=Carya illinoinensis TaxID=32201 RepID=A0A8T1QRE1_CARIL|nr:uncharacterized protein LOC122308317 isoform X2 [Carya illinoinensis]KAG2710757.1 hypothetical protein I3760_04G043400 [Carya illinoinensis]KAG6656763.1 hypothetical protein CIPAW_04G044500 [Carya illinoinensis]KAG7982265.1 hypothetical protein I3843_04G042400 [Carya illinoinensis]KAG7982266.1 hypothetical protein I3843_04G042400 [Carya illinoinensis]
MIKRRFYKLEHADKDQASDSSSSSDSELEAEAIDDSDDDVVAEVKENEESCSTSSGLTIVDDDAETGNERQILTDSHLSGKCGSEALETHSNIMAEKELLPADIPACIMKCKSVFKCRICPRIICLNEETLRAHLDSKRHARSEKLLNEGRLKAILNSDGEIENQETPAEMNARILALPLNNKKRKSRNRLGEEKRQIKKEMGYEENIKKARKLTKGPSKKRHKNEN